MKIRLATPESAARYQHYKTVVEAPEFEWLGTIEAPYSSFRDAQGIVISDEWHNPTRLAIAECKKQKIPVFHIIDGILEWRNLFEHSRSVDPKKGSPLFQPVLADHTFCMGAFQKWQLEWLGNASIHPSGLPRLDGIKVAPCRSRAASDPPRLLVATANTPWFDAAQHRRFTVEFSHLAELCLRETARPRPDFQCTWRIAADAASPLGLSPDSSGTAAAALAACDGLLTTPSTLAVEAMLAGVPTLIFDPFACPGFIPSAWHATSAETAFGLIPSLLRPAEERCRLQDSLRSLMTPSDQAASERVRNCILQVVRNGCAPPPAAAEPMFAGKGSPLHDFASKGFPPHFSPADIHGLLASLPSLDAKIASQQQRIEELQRQLYTPSLKDGVRALLRGFANTFRTPGK